MDIDSDIYNWINTKVLLASNSEFLELESEETEQGIYQPPHNRLIYTKFILVN